MLASGKLLVIGGSGTPSAEVYDPVTNTWTATAPMSSIRILHAAIGLPDGRALVVGGTTGSGALRVVEFYNPATNNWTPSGQLVTARRLHAAALLPNGKVLVSGGASASGPFLAEAEVYDPVSDTWSATGSMSTPRVNHTMTVLPNGRVLAGGGAAVDTGGTLRTAEIYDPATGTWTPTAEMAAARSNHTATLLPSGKVLFSAGRGETGDIASAELFDSGTAPATSVSAARFTFGATPDSIGAVFGSNLASEPLSATSVPLPTELGGLSVRVVDGAGIERVVLLFFVSPGQINYLIPGGAVPGSGVVKVLRGGSIIAGGALEIVRVAPGFFTADRRGTDVPAAQVFRRTAAGVESVTTVASFDATGSRFVAVPIDLGPETDQVFLILYGTGIRFRASLSSVRVLIGGIGSEVIYAGETPGFFGLDQINVRLGRSLGGRGDIEVVVTIDGRAANRVRVTIR